MMIKIIVVCCVFLPFSLKGYASSDKIICAPQKFSEKINSYCCDNNIDGFLDWLGEIDLPSMNKALIRYNQVCIPSIIVTAEEKEQLREWKTAYYQKFQEAHQTKPFLLAGEFYPFNALVNSIGLSFYGYCAGAGKKCLDALIAVNASIKPLSHRMTHEQIIKK